jgi:hypothetical protein
MQNRRIVLVLGHAAHNAFDNSVSDSSHDVLVASSQVSNGAKSHLEQVRVFVEPCGSSANTLHALSTNCELYVVADESHVGQGANNILQKSWLLWVDHHELRKGWDTVTLDDAGNT